MSPLSTIQALSWISCFFIFPLLAYGQEIIEFDLDNGLHILVNPIPEADDIGVETFYRVGFVNEPKEMVQSSHLVEHLVCYAKGAGFEDKQAMKWLNEVGMANGETLPDMTHYDYAAPAENLEQIIQVIASRLQQKEFDREMQVTESKRVYQEADFVESRPETGMVKHAFMSLAHGWKYQAKDTQIRGGLEQIELDKLHAFYSEHYHPGNLTLVISGKTTEEEVKQLAGKHLAQIPGRERVDSSISWDDVKARNQIGWDSKNSAICIAWKPPSDARQQLLLSILGMAILQKTRTNNSLNEKFTLVMTSNPNWKVGELPMFIYGMAKPDQNLDELEKTLEEFMDSAIEESIKTAPEIAKALATNYEFQLKPTAWPRAQQSAGFLSRDGRSKTQSIQLVILQDALNRGIIDRFLGRDAQDSIDFLKATTVQDFQDSVDKCLIESNRFYSHLVPSDR